MFDVFKGLVEADNIFEVNVIEVDVVEVLEIVVGREDMVVVELTVAAAADEEKDVFVALGTDEIVDEVEGDTADVKIVVSVIAGEIVVDCEEMVVVAVKAAVAVDEEEKDETAVVLGADVVVVWKVVDADVRIGDVDVKVVVDVFKGVVEVDSMFEVDAKEVEGVEVLEIAID